jgi:hypothetical protein
MRSVEVRVVDHAGRCRAGVPVTCFIYQTLANGQKSSSTNSQGCASFDLDVDEYAQIQISVNHGKHVSERGPIRAEYRFVI